MHPYALLNVFRVYVQSHQCISFLHFVDNVCLFLHREGSLTLVRSERMVGSNLNITDHVLTHPHDLLTNVN